MKLLSFKLLEVFPKDKNIKVLFTFDTGEETHMIHCGQMAFNDIKTEEVEVKRRVYVRDEKNNIVTDEEGNKITEIKTETETKNVPFVNSKSRIDLFDIESFKNDIQEFAIAYIVGIEQKANEYLGVPKEIKNLIGQTHKI